MTLSVCSPLKEGVWKYVMAVAAADQLKSARI
jgi:hypothetical protein